MSEFHLNQWTEAYLEGFRSKFDETNPYEDNHDRTDWELGRLDGGVVQASRQPVVK